MQQYVSNTSNQRMFFFIFSHLTVLMTCVAEGGGLKA